MIKKFKYYSGVKKLKIKLTRKRVLAGAMTFAVLFSLVGCSKKNKTTSEDATSEYAVSSISRHSIDDLGEKISMPSKSEIDKQRYGSVVSGNIDPNKVVIGSDGDVYINAEAAKNASNAGKTTIDDKGGTLDVSGEKVREKTEGYEVKDSNGNVVAKGNGSTPEGYVYDENQGAYVKAEDTGNVYADANYYDKETGELIIAKGDLVSKETLARAKQVLTTTKPQKNNSNQSTSNQSNSSKQQENKNQSNQQENKNSSNAQNNQNSGLDYYEAPDGSIWSSESAYKEYLAGQNNSNSDDEVLYEVDGNLMTEEEFEAYQKTLTR